MSVLLSILVCCSLALIPNEAAKILAVFPVPSISHQVVFRPLTQELAKRGHEVTVITPDPAFPKDGTPPNLTEIDVHEISYSIWSEHFMKASTRGNKNDIISQVDIIIGTMPLIVEAQLETDDVKKMIHDKKQTFDLILIEACVRPALVFSHVYKNVPVILVSSFGAVPGNFDLLGAPTHPMLYPEIIRVRLNNLTLWEKISEIYNHFLFTRIYDKYVDLENKLLRKYFGPDVPSVEDLGSNVDMLFLNVHQVFTGIQPVPPSVVYMGGMHQKPKKELPEDLKTYLDSSKNGVIYLSFGTNVDPTLLPPEKIQILVRVFAKLPYDVLMKWNHDVLPGKSDNIRISKWLPQSDLLQHPKIKLFITQGGLQSTDEAITAGVPLIGVPMLGDQWYNVEKYLYHKIGVKVDLETISEVTFKKAIETVIGDQSYRRNIIKLRELINDQPMRPLERAVWWTEHVLRHGGAKHLRSPAANISWAQYLELELVLTLLIGLLITALLLVLSIYLVYKKVLSTYLFNIKVKRN